MPDLTFEIEGAQIVRFAIAPHLALKLRITNAMADEQIHAVLLQCQVRIDAASRAYSAREAEALGDLFGEPARWAQTLKSLLWSQVSVTVPPFVNSVGVDLPVACTFDVNVAATKFFDALEGNDVPLTLLFSGTVFHAVLGALQVVQIPWSKEATFRLPVRVWKETMDHYQPNGRVLSLEKSVFDRLGHYKRSRGLLTWERAVESLLDEKSPEPV